MNKQERKEASKARIRQQLADKAKKSPPTLDQLEMKLIHFGAYYEDDKDQGWSIIFTPDTETKTGWIKFLSECIEGAGREILKEVKVGTWDIKGIKEQLGAAINSFNIKNFGSEVRPLRSQVTYDIQASIPEIVCIMSDIFALHRWERFRSNAQAVDQLAPDTTS